MQLSLVDWIIAFFAVAICFAPALFFGKRSSKDTSEFFASGRSVPWWLAGLSMVATTFSSDTPNLVTDIVRRLVISVARGYLRADNGPCLVLATLSGERHELGILMCSWLAATRRYHTHYLGADCPAGEIARFALEVEARAVLISLVMPENQVPVLEQLRELAGTLRGKCEIWIGGFAARQLLPEEVPVGCVLLPGPLDFEQRLDLLAAERFG